MPTKTKKATAKPQGLIAQIKSEADIERLADKLQGKYEFNSDEVDLHSLLTLLWEMQDHSIRFVDKEIRDSEYVGTRLYLVPYSGNNRDWRYGKDRRTQKWYVKPDIEIDYMPYDSFDTDTAYIAAYRDQDTLNQIILDFYGIKKHADIKSDKQTLRTEIANIRAEIDMKKSEIKALDAKIKKLSKSL